MFFAKHPLVRAKIAKAIRTSSRTLACIVKHFLNSSGKGRHYHITKEGIQTCKQEGTNNHRKLTERISYVMEEYKPDSPCDKALLLDYNALSFQSTIHYPF